MPLRADVLGLLAHGARIAWRGRRDLSHGTPRVALPSLVRRRTRSGPGRAATAVRLVCVAVLDAGAAANFIEDCAMNDIRRTLLWVVFSMSLVLLWDGWNKHNGEPSLFSPKPAPTTAAPQGATGATSAASVPLHAVPPATAVAGAGTTAAAAPTAPPAAAPAAAELVTITTDVFAFTFDSNGGDPVKVELLQEVDQNDPSRKVVLFDRSPHRVYLAQTGLIGAPGTAPLPTHLTPMKWVPGPREMVAGSDSLQVRFESADVGGARLVKTYTFKRGSSLLNKFTRICLSRR